jgi:hypothetical protein
VTLAVVVEVDVDLHSSNIQNGKPLMHPIAHYLSSCLNRKLLEPSPIGGVYWSVSIPRKLGIAQARRQPSILLELGDFLVSDYSTLKQRRRDVERLAPGSWSHTEIHHIVENFHLQFLGVEHPLSKHTYDHEEPCVLMPRKQHNLQIENAVGWAEKLEMERQPFDFIQAFRDAHPGVSDEDRTEAPRIRARWVREQELMQPQQINRRVIQQTLRNIYNFAYQQPEFEPLRLIATEVIDGML